MCFTYPGGVGGGDKTYQDEDKHSCRRRQSLEVAADVDDKEDDETYGNQAVQDPERGG